MKCYSVTAAVLFTAGILSFVAALDDFASASQCTPVAVSPATCRHAYALPPQGSFGQDCQFINSTCVNMGGCTATYGIAEAGQCEMAGIGGGSGGAGECIEDAHLTLIDIDYYTGSCEYGQYGCYCKWKAAKRSKSATVRIRTFGERHFGERKASACWPVCTASLSARRAILMCEPNLMGLTPHARLPDTRRLSHSKGVS